MNAERNARRGQKAVRPPVKAPAAKKRIDGEMLQYYSLLIPVLALIFVFCYIPMYGIVIAFQDYLPGSAFSRLRCCAPVSSSSKMARSISMA